MAGEINPTMGARFFLKNTASFFRALMTREIVFVKKMKRKKPDLRYPFWMTCTKRFVQ